MLHKASLFLSLVYETSSAHWENWLGFQSILSFNFNHKLFETNQNLLIFISETLHKFSRKMLSNLISFSSCQRKRTETPRLLSLYCCLIFMKFFCCCSNFSARYPFLRRFVDSVSDSATSIPVEDYSSEVTGYCTQDQLTWALVASCHHVFVEEVLL